MAPNIEFIPQGPPIWQTQLASDVLPGDLSGTFAAELMIDGLALSGLVMVSIDIGQPNPEYILGTLSGNVLTFTVRNAKPLDPTVSIGAFTSTHRAGAVVKITDFGMIQMMRNLLQGLKDLQNPLLSPVPATLPTQIPNFSQLTSAIIAGGMPATTLIMGITRLAKDIPVPLGTATITIASPAVITIPNHGLTTDDIVVFATTGSLPTGITAGVPYYVLAAGLTANDFEISLTAGGTAINTSGSQSGVQSVTKITPVALAGNLDTNNALEGTSGIPPSLLNKFIDNADSTNGDTTDQSQTIQDANTSFGEADATTKHNLVAQSYVAGKTPITAVSLFKDTDTGAFTGDVTITIQKDNAGSPSGTVLATVTILNGAWLALTNGAHQFNFAANFLQIIGTTYWIVASSSTSDNANHPNLGVNSAGGYPSGSVKFKNTTDGWVAIATIDLYFKVIIDISNKVLRLNSSGELPPTVVPSSLRPIIDILAGETIAAGQAVYEGIYQPVPILFDNQVNAGAASSSAVPFGVVQSFTVANNSNRILIICMNPGPGQPTNSSAVITAMQYNGIPMTLLTGTSSTQQVWYLLNPDVGTHNITFTVSPSNGGPYTYGYIFTALSYYNVASISALTFLSTLNSTVPISTESSIVISFSANISNISTPYTAPQITQNVSHNSTGFGGGISGFVDIGNTVEIDNPGDANIFGAGNSAGIITLTLVPSSTPLYGYARLASAINDHLGNFDRLSKFLGFAFTGGIATDQISVQTSQLVLGLSGLTKGSLYYLDNTFGAISTGGGNILHQVGIAISTTTLLILENKTMTKVTIPKTAGITYIADSDGFLSFVNTVTGATKSITVDGVVVASVHDDNASESSTAFAPVARGQSYVLDIDGKFTPLI